MTTPYIFDSHAVLAFFQKEKVADHVSNILRNAIRREIDRFISVINLDEIIYITKRHFGDAKKIEFLVRVHQLGFKTLQAPEPIEF